MRIGKMDSDRLVADVLSKLQPRREEVVLRPGVGEDCGALDLMGDLCVVSTDPVTVPNSDVGRIAVHINCNDIAACGGEPGAMVITILAPENTPEHAIADIMEQVSEAASEVNIEVIGGHTEITDAVNRIVVSGTAFGKCPRHGLVQSRDVRPGDGLIITKYAGIEGTIMMCSEFYDRAVSAVTFQRLGQVDQLKAMLSVVPDGMIAARAGACAMHDITEGGVLGAVHEVCSAAGCGAALDESKIPVLDLTLDLCREFAIDPLRLISSGSMLIASPRPQEVMDALMAAGIPAAQIGRAEAAEAGFTIQCKDGVERTFGPPRPDEIYKLFK